MDIIIQKLKYNNHNLLIFKDKHNKIWFNGHQMCKILGYMNPTDIIKLLVNIKHIKQLKDIFDNYKIYHNAQPHTIYLNESGMYTLLIRSKKPKAELFFLWIVEDVLPSIRKNGYYEADDKMIKQFEEFEKIIQQKDAELKDKTLKILTLENNQKDKHLCIQGKYIYVLKSVLNDYINEDAPDILKIGKTTKYKIRMSTYNTGQKDNTIILYRVKTNDISAVENCLKGLLSKKVYRSYKEYYNITLKEAINTIKKCIKLTGSKLISEDKFYHKYKIKRSARLKGFNYGLSNENCQTDQKGGTYYDSNFPIVGDTRAKGGKNEFKIKSYAYYDGLYGEFNKLIKKLINH